MPGTFETWEEQKNNFAFDQEKEKCLRKKQEVVGSNKVVLPHTFWVLKFLTLSNNNWSHHQSNLDLFQEICLTLLPSLEALFTKSV